MTKETLFVIEGVGFPAMSARGCNQSLTVVENGEFKRTINGDLVFVGAKAQKYKSVVRCADKEVPAFDGCISRGDVVRVECIQRLWKLANAVDVELDRSYVKGSVDVVTQNQEFLEFKEVSDQKIVIDENGFNQAKRGPQELKVYVNYRPVLWMRVISFGFSTDEWGLKTEWKLELEEV